VPKVLWFARAAQAAPPSRDDVRVMDEVLASQA